MSKSNVLGGVLLGEHLFEQITRSFFYIDTDGFFFFLNHPEKSIRAKARAVLTKPTATRQAVVDRYRSALDMVGDPAAGVTADVASAGIRGYCGDDLPGP